MLPNRKLLAGFAALLAVVAAGTWACGSTAMNSALSPSSVGSSSGTGSREVDAKPGGTSAYQLNLSHVTCTDGGKVEIHFVLLNVETGITPGNLTYSVNGVVQSPIAPGPHTGNVWHYSILVSPGTIDVTAASVVVNGVTVTLHNPDAYSGKYVCSNTPACPAAEAIASSLTCLDHPLSGGPQAECDHFLPGSTALVKDDSGADPGTAITDAALAIVVAGSGQTGCSPSQIAYRLIPDVTVGQTLPSPGSGTSISHVTFCSCPTAAP